jgi:hypothetical protein
MCFDIPEVRVGEPGVCGAVAVFPLFTGLPLFPVGSSPLQYLLASEALANGFLTVTEATEEGVVGRLFADNAGDQPVLFVDGEELKGAKQNRAVSESILIAAKSRTRIPVCCVQRRRWAYSTRQFSSGSCCPPTLRRLLKKGSPASDSQTAVWREIRRKHEATGTRSEKENLSDALESHREAVESMRINLPYVEGASGMVVAIAGEVVSVDLFDKSAALATLWDRLVQGVAIDALEVGDTGCRADSSDILVRLYRTKGMGWRQVATVGLGEAFRAQDDDALATALVVDGVPIHLSMSMAM